MREHTPELHLRERQVLIGVADGLTCEEIGRRLFLSPWTVRGYLKRVLGTLGAANRAHAVAIAIRNGLIP